MGGEDQQSRLFYELCALLFAVLRSPHIAFPSAALSAPSGSPPPPMPRAVARRPRQMSPAGFASLLLGASLALMLCGSVTFVIGFFLMPWIIGMVMVFCFVGFVSNLSWLGRAVLCPNLPESDGCSPKDMSGPFFSKIPII